MRYQILPCRLSHIREILRTMRAKDRREFEIAGTNPKHRLYELYRMTAEPKAALVDGEVALIGGDAASFLAQEGLMWMVTAPPIERVPLAFFREMKRELQRLLSYRQRLRSCIAGPYEEAIRFYSLLGFEVSEPELIGGHEYRQITLAR